MVTSPRKDVLRYWRSIMNDKREPTARRDKAAAMLVKLINKRDASRTALRRARIAKELRKAGRQRTHTRIPRESAPGKKDIKKAVAQTTATSGEWDGLIPKAQVIPIKRAAK